VAKESGERGPGGKGKEYSKRGRNSIWRTNPDRTGDGRGLIGVKHRREESRNWKGRTFLNGN